MFLINNLNVFNKFWYASLQFSVKYLAYFCQFANQSHKFKTKSVEHISMKSQTCFNKSLHISEKCLTCFKQDSNVILKSFKSNFTSFLQVFYKYYSVYKSLTYF